MCTTGSRDKKNTYVYMLSCKHTRCMPRCKQQQFERSCGLQSVVNGLREGRGAGDHAGENLVPSPASKPLKATVLFSIEVLY